MTQSARIMEFGEPLTLARHGVTYVHLGGFASDAELEGLLVRPDDLSNALDAQSFRPFALNMSNGESYRVTHPEQIMVDGSAAIIGTHRVNGPRRYERLVTCALVHVVSLVPLEETEIE